MEWLNQIEFWYWQIAAIFMIFIEMILPLSYFLWMGVSAFIVGLVLYAIPNMPLLTQVIIFFALSVVTLIIYKRYKKNDSSVNDESNLNNIGEQYIGSLFTLDEPIVNGVGKIKVDDATWEIKGSDQPAGVKVRVLSVDGTTFNIETETLYSE